MNYEQFLPTVLFVLGIPIQFARAHKTFAEFWVYAIATVVALGGYFLCHTFTADLRLEIIQAIIWIPGGTASMLGGTFTASGAAKAGVSVIPITNSK